MPSCPRHDVVDKSEVGVYHCRARCVRQSYLCGTDARTGENYEHRRSWVRDHLRKLAGLFAIDVLAYALLSNHLHLVVRTRCDVADGWSDESVAWRWRAICAVSRDLDGSFTEPAPEKVAATLSDPEKTAQARRRLSNVSWLMGKLCEWLARRANQEEGRTGRFWEGRFRCDRLADEAALLTCAMYVDLNPVRARLADTPEASEFTSAYDRILAEQAGRLKRQGEQPPTEWIEADQWLTPLTLDESPEAKQSPDQEPAAPAGEAENETPALQRPRRASDKGFLPMSVEEYLKLLDWTGRQLREGKRGAIPAHLAPILERLEIRAEQWLDAVARFGKLFHGWAGREDHVQRLRERAGRQRFPGRRHCQAVFSLA